MKFHAAKCPQCSGALQIPDDKERVQCMYCGVTIVVEQAIKSSKDDPVNLLNLAKKSEESENYSEAYDLYSRVLELIPNSIDAWRGKGFSAGMQSTLMNLRCREMIVCYENSLKFCEDETERNLLKCEYAQSALLVANAIFNLSFKHTIDFISLNEAQFEHADRCKEITGLCEYALKLDSNQTSAIDLILTMSRACKGISYLDQDTREFYKRKLDQYKNKEAKSPSSGTGSDAGGVFLGIVFLVINFMIAKNFFGFGAIGSFITAFLLVLLETTIFVWGTVLVMKIRKNM